MLQTLETASRAYLTSLNLWYLRCSLHLTAQETYVSIVAALEGHVALSNPEEGRVVQASDGKHNTIMNSTTLIFGMLIACLKEYQQATAV